MSDVNETMTEANETSSCDFTIKLPQKLRSTFGFYWFFEKFNVKYFFICLELNISYFFIKKSFCST